MIITLIHSQKIWSSPTIIIVITIIIIFTVKVFNSSFLWELVMQKYEQIFIFAKDLFMFLKSSTALFVCLFVCCVCLFVVFTHFHSTGEENRYIFVAHHHDLKSSCCLFQEKFENYKSNKIQALKVGVQYVVTKARKRSHCPNTRKQNISKVQIRKTKQCWHWRLWKRKIGLVRCGNQSKSRESLSYHKKTKH